MQNAIVLLDEASPLEDVDTAIDLPYAFLEGVIRHVYLLVLLLIPVLENICEVYLASLEARLCDPRLTILSVQCLHYLQAVFNELYPGWSGWFRLLNGVLSVAFELLPEPLLLVATELIEHLLLGAEELLLLPLLLLHRDPLLLLLHLALSLGELLGDPDPILLLLLRQLLLLDRPLLADRVLELLRLLQLLLLSKSALWLRLPLLLAVSVSMRGTYPTILSSSLKSASSECWSIHSRAFSVVPP